MLRPSIYNRNSMLEDFFEDFFETPFFKSTELQNMAAMKTDIRENAGSYEVIMDLPGFKKEDVRAELKDGYLTVLASHSEEKKEDADTTYIRRERYTGHYRRSFYVGENLKQEDIHARFADGVLTLDIRKKEPEPELPDKKYIAIED